MTTSSSDHTDYEEQIAELRSLVPVPAAPTEVVVAKKKINRDKPELPAYFVAMICIVCIAILTFHGDVVPDVLNLATIGSLGIGGAVTQAPRSGGD